MCTPDQALISQNAIPSIEQHKHFQQNEPMSDELSAFVDAFKIDPKLCRDLETNIYVSVPFFVKFLKPT